MAYVSLYRKYRPQTFSDVVGQTHVTTTLAQAVAEDRVSHAYLFTGPRGTGKTSTARILAKALNCERGPTAEPCNACTHCRAITGGSSVDVIEIDAASHGGVEDVRDLRDRVAFAPASARRKVYIVDECHMLSTAGWNAFLKTVEEPPGHVVFVFATTEPHKVLDTILSRTQRFDFRRVGAGVLADHVRALGELEGVQFEPGAVDLVVRAGDGSVRDTLSVLDQVVAFTGSHVTVEGVADVLGAVPEELVAQTADLIATGDVAGLCVLVGRLADAGHDLRQFAREAVEHLRALFLLQSAPDAGLVEATAERLARLRAQSARLGRVELLRAVELLAEAQAQMRRGSVRLPLEIALAKAALPEAAGDPGAVAARMDRLERRTGLVEGAGSASPPSEAASPEPAAPARVEPAAAESVSPSPEPASPEPASPEPASRESASRESASRESASPSPASPSPAPPEPAADAEPRPPETPPVDLELVIRSWEAVLRSVKARKIRFSAMLQMGRPVALDSDVLTVAFPAGYGLHAESCGTDPGQTVVAEAVEEVLGIRPRVRCVVTDGDAEGSALPGEQAIDDEASDVAEAEAAEAAGDLPDAQEAQAAAIQTLRRDLGATVVDES